VNRDAIRQLARIGRATRQDRVGSVKPDARVVKACPVAPL
jgi:hypothetical protein